MKWKTRTLVVVTVLGLGPFQFGQTTFGESQPAEEADLPAGPSVDFCPSPEQTEAHFAKYGFDYKPTLACTREGEVESSETTTGTSTDDLADELLQAEEKALLKSARPARDDDGNPATIEGVLPDGREILIIVQTEHPEEYEGMTPSGFADRYYP